MSHLIRAVCLVLALGLVALAGENSQDGVTTSSHDTREFESLGDELLEGLPLPTFEDQRQGTEPGASPLARIEQGMREAKRLLAQGLRTQEQLGKPVLTVQQQVVTELDTLIEQLRQSQCKACSGGQPSKSPASRRSQTAGAKPSAASPAKSVSQAKSSAQDSTDHLNSGQAIAGRSESVEEVLRRLWGQLPQRVREQMLQTPADEFLPKYRLEIENYFRRLAEENGGGQIDDL